MTPSNIVLGLWPIAGITTVGVKPSEAITTIEAAIEHGINTFDTAYSYGFDGESDRLLGDLIRKDRERFVVMGKVGQRWNADRERIVDGTPEQLTRDAESSLRRIGTDYFDTLFLHSPDPSVPLETSAAAMQQMKERGWCKQLGICNATSEQITAFSKVAETAAIQCPLNMVQHEQQRGLVEESHNAGIQVYAFWVLMKGLLAGRIRRDHVFAPGDSRPSYPIFQGDLRQSIHDALDDMLPIAQQTNQTIAQLAIGWVLSQPGVTAALVGARRPDQIIETASARPLEEETLERIDAVLRVCRR